MFSFLVVFLFYVADLACLAGDIANCISGVVFAVHETCGVCDNAGEHRWRAILVLEVFDSHSLLLVGVVPRVAHRHVADDHADRSLLCSRKMESQKKWRVDSRRESKVWVVDAARWRQ